jgi:drug/metabolite transporter (DMT)-like permease
MGGAAATFALLNAAAKYLGRSYPTAEIVWARTLGHLVFVTLAFAPSHGLKLFETRQLGAQVTRSLLLLASTTFNFTALRFIGLADATAILFTSPLIVALLSVPLLGERVGARRWAAIGIGFLGTLVVIRPGAGLAQAASLFALGSAGCYAVYQILTRRVVASDPPETAAGHSALAATAVMTALVPFWWTTPRSPFDWLLFLSLGPSGGLGHYCVARAYLWGPAAVVSPFNYLQLLGAAATGYAIFGDVPGAGLWLGACLIIASGLVVAYAERGRESPS